MNSAPILYLPHGGGPLPLLGDPHHARLTTFLRSVAANWSTPRAILMISAHWEAALPTVSSSMSPGMLYDYGGFPPESYRILYPAPGDPQLAEAICERLQQYGMESLLDDQRGFDHGTFVPLKLMYPEAQIPVVQLSLTKGLDPAHHILMGKAIAALAEDQVMIVGSGLSFHNMHAFMTGSPDALYQSEQFDQWLQQTLLESPLAEAEQRLIDWQNAPSARYSHPREEHLLPLHLCFGAASSLQRSAACIFNDILLGARVSGFAWG